MWFTFAVLAALVWGVGQVLSKKGLSHTTALANNFLGASFGLLLDVALILSGRIEWRGIGWTLLFAFLAQAGFMIYFYALERGPVAITGTLIALFPVATVVLSVVFLGERLGPFQIAGVVVAIGASLALSWPAKGVDQWRPAWIGWGLLGAAIIGTADFFGKAAIDHSNVYAYLFGLALASLVILPLLALLDVHGRELPDLRKPVTAFTVLGALGMSGGGILIDFAFANGPAALVSPITGSYVGVSALLAVLFLGERINPRQIGGVILAGAGVALLGVV